MLIYHPIHDPNHCIFRLLCILYDLKLEEVAWDTLKLLDFYVLFPHFMAEIKLPQEFISSKKVLKTIAAPYESLPAASRLMYELSIIQEQVAQSLLAKGIFEQDSFTSGRIKMRNTFLRDSVMTTIESASFRKREWYFILLSQISRINLYGLKGLKDRTKLMEYRYDPI